MTALAATGSWSRRAERPGGSPRPRRASFAWYPAYGGEIYLPPQPGPRRCYAWGRSLREIPDARPERVALMASGGMSHYPGTDRYASPDFDWDRSLLSALTEGRGAETARLTGEELDKAGNVELRTWITLLGAVGPARAQVICYEPSWHYGNAMVTWPVAPSGAAR